MTGEELCRCFTFVVSGADPGFDQGGAQIVTGLNCRRAQQCRVSEASPFQHGVQGPP